MKKKLVGKTSKLSGTGLLLRETYRNAEKAFGLNTLRLVHRYLWVSVINWHWDTLMGIVPEVLR